MLAKSVEKKEEQPLLKKVTGYAVIDEEGSHRRRSVAPPFTVAWKITDRQAGSSQDISPTAKAAKMDFRW